jgi:hypothetical protein
VRPDIFKLDQTFSQQQSGQLDLRLGVLQLESEDLGDGVLAAEFLQEGKVRQIVQIVFKGSQEQI